MLFYFLYREIGTWTDSGVKTRLQSKRPENYCDWQTISWKIAEISGN